MERNLIELAWAAGFFDGEGTVYPKRLESGRIYPRLQVVQTRPEPIYRFQNALGLGSVGGPYERAGVKRPVWVCFARGSEESLAAVNILAPLVCVPKAEQMRAVLEECIVGCRENPPKRRRAQDPATGRFQGMALDEGDEDDPFLAGVEQALADLLRLTPASEHVLLGVCREGTTFTADEVERLRDQTIRMLSGSRTSEPRPKKWEAVESRTRCLAGFSLYGANFHCQSDLDHDAADGHVEHGDGWTMRWES